MASPSAMTTISAATPGSIESSLLLPVTTISPSTTLASNALPLPTPSSPNANCYYMVTPPASATGAVAISPFNDITYSYLQTCCKDAPITVINDACQAYCTPLNQSSDQLKVCFYVNGVHNGTDGGLMLPGIVAMADNGGSAGQAASTQITASIPPGATATPTVSASGSAGASGGAPTSSSAAVAVGRKDGAVGGSKQMMLAGTVVLGGLVAGAVL